MLSELAEALFIGAKWAVSFRKEARKGDDRSELSNNDVLKAVLRQSLSDISSAKKLTARNNLFQLLWYQQLISRFSWRAMWI